LHHTRLNLACQDEEISAAIASISQPCATFACS
jgi:hypothetical protein